jgi:hypothetical protein
MEPWTVLAGIEGGGDTQGALLCRVRIGFEPAFAGGGLPGEPAARRTTVFPERARPPS